MELNPYRILVQLIPGTLFLGTVLINEMKLDIIKDVSWAYALYIGLIALILGYIFNGIGHLLEGIYFRNGLEKRIQKNLKNPKKGGSVIRFFRIFSIVRSDETIESFRAGSYMKKYDSTSRNWSKEECKFARTLIITSITAACYLYFYPRHSMRCDMHWYLKVFFWILLSVSTYRYIVSRIDYSFKQLRKN